MLKRLEKWYVIFGILLFAGGLIPFKRAQGENTPLLAHINVALEAVVFSIFILFFFANSRRVLSAFLRIKNIVLLCLLVTVSTLWSIDPKFTLKHAILFLGLTLFTLYFSERFTLEQQVQLMRSAIVFEIFLTLATVVLIPAAGISGDLHSGSWKGPFIHKNMLGLFMATGFLYFFFAKSSVRSPKVRGALIFATAALLLLSRSATPAFDVLVTLFVMSILAFSKVKKPRNIPLFVPLLPLILCIPIIPFMMRDLILSSAGKDSTLTGRLPLWNAVLKNVANQPWLGFGYASFWGTENIHNLGVLVLAGWRGAHAHNGYLDILLDVGGVGLVIFLWGYFASLKQAVKNFRNDIGLDSGWPPALLIFLAIYNLTESNLMRNHAYMWLPYVWITYELAKKRDLVSSRQSHERAEEAKLEYA